MVHLKIECKVCSCKGRSLHIVCMWSFEYREYRNIGRITYTVKFLKCALNLKWQPVILWFMESWDNTQKRIFLGEADFWLFNLCNSGVYVSPWLLQIKQLLDDYSLSNGDFHWLAATKRCVPAASLSCSLLCTALYPTGRVSEAERLVVVFEFFFICVLM